MEGEGFGGAQGTLCVCEGWGEGIRTCLSRFLHTTNFLRCIFMFLFRDLGKDSMGGRDYGCTHVRVSADPEPVCWPVRAQVSTLPRVPRRWGCVEPALARQDARAASHGLRHQKATKGMFFCERV